MIPLMYGKVTNLLLPWERKFSGSVISNPKYFVGKPFSEEIISHVCGVICSATANVSVTYIAKTVSYS